MGKVGRALTRSLRTSGLCVATFHGRPWPETLPAGQKAIFLCIPEAALVPLMPKLGAMALPFVTVSGSLKKTPGLRTFHPLMGFSEKGPRDFAGIPTGVDDARLFALAKRIGAKPFMLPDDRTLYHAGAVMGGAGVLAAFEDACAVLKHAGLHEPRAVLLPIATQALLRGALTGPIVRGDEKTIAMHERALRALPAVRKTYRALLSVMRRLHEAAR
jgi:Domain of unknown function (DUF2520)